MIKIKLHFTLTGKTNEWKKYICKDTGINWNNANTLDYVKGLITKQFGNRPMVFINEKSLTNDSIPYLKYFTASWFISEDGVKELVVVAHGDSMEKANKVLTHYIKNIEWDNLAKNV